MTADSACAVGISALDGHEIMDTSGAGVREHPDPCPPPVKGAKDMANGTPQVVTQQGALAGQTHYEAVVPVLIPLDDSEAEGNLGLQGYDEETVGQRAPNEGLARAAAVRLAKRERALGRIVDSVEVREVQWVGDEWNEPGWGLVRDASPVTRRVRIGYLTDAGSVTWDDWMSS